jgi:hypothetical protein
MLPVQDCSRTYGGAITMLEIETLTEQAFSARPRARFVAPGSAAPFRAGLHTMAAAGPVTLIDVKRTEMTLEGIAMRPARELRKIFGHAQ